MNKFKKLLIGFSLFCVLFLSFTPKTEAAGYPVIDFVNLIPNSVGAISGTVHLVKDSVLDTIGWMIAKMIIQRITSQTVNWINSGFQGNPAFITNPGKFFLDVGDETASWYISAGNLSALCEPFKANVRLALVKTYLAQTPNQSYSCTLGGIINNYRNFTEDFSEGGWDSWFNITQNSQSNPYGTYLDTLGQMGIEVGTKQFKYAKQLDWAQGFLSSEKCLGQTVHNPNTGKDECKGKKETITPGSVIAGQLSKQLGAGTDTLVTADEINEIIGALLSQLMGKVFSSGGLKGQSYDSTSAQRQLSDEFRQVMQTNATELATAGGNTQTDIDTRVNNYPSPAMGPYPTPPTDLPTFNVNCSNCGSSYPTPSTYPTPASYTYPTPTYPTPGGTYPTPSGNFYPTPSGSFYPTPADGRYLTPANGTYITPASGVYPTPTYLTPVYSTPIIGNVPPFPYPTPYPTPTNPGGTPSGNTNWVRSLPVSGIASVPIFWDGGTSPTSGTHFTVSAPVGDHRACVAGLASLFQTNPGDPWVYRNESVTYCGICNATTLICNQTRYYSCTIDYFNTTDPACP